MRTHQDGPATASRPTPAVAATVDAAVRSQAGTERPCNEDRAFVGQTVFAVADGMGGGRDGDVAAEEAMVAARAADDRWADATPVVEQLRRVVEEANTRVHGREGPGARDTRMGTTLTVVAVTCGQVAIAWVGDSPAFRVRDGRCEKLTMDHTLVHRLVEQGDLEPDEAWGHPRNNVITRAVGPRDDVDVDTTSADVRGGDWVVVCSDGISDAVRPEVIAELVASSSDASSACDRLVEAALRGESSDDLTALVLRIAG